jgi:hypothetical protein
MSSVLIKKKQRSLFGKYVIKFLHDCAKTHKHNYLRNAITEINHLSYSPDFARCYYWLFDYVKKRLGQEQGGNQIRVVFSKRRFWPFVDKN